MRRMVSENAQKALKQITVTDGDLKPAEIKIQNGILVIAVYDDDDNIYVYEFKNDGIYLDGDKITN